jgi:hypothetical protein
MKSGVYIVSGFVGGLVGSIITWTVMVGEVEKANNERDTAKSSLIQEMERPPQKCFPEKFRWI